MEVQFVTTEYILAKQSRVDEEAKSGIYAHLGCGPQIKDNYINIDKYHNEDKRVLPCCMSELPFSDSYLDAVVSNHALEHLSHTKAREAIREWSRVIKRGGKLYLTIPDLGEICRLMISDDVNFIDQHFWYIATLFGYQQKGGTNFADPSEPDDPGQHHRTGFTARSIEHFLINAGFQIKDIQRYDGYRTPSLWIEAFK